MKSSKKILAAASEGGHWVQMLRVSKAFEDLDVSYITTKAAYAKDVEGALYAVTDANARKKIKLVKMFFQVALVIVRVRPDVVISTGAAPGFAAILLGRLLGAKTIWIDSIANAEALSLSGKLAGRWADVWLTQWEHLANNDGPQYWGSVL